MQVDEARLAFTFREQKQNLAGGSQVELLLFMRDFLRLTLAAALSATVAWSHATGRQAPAGRVVHMTVLYSGKPVGEALYKDGPDGAFSSSVAFSIGGANFKERIEGHYAGSKLKDYTAVQALRDKDVTLVVKDGKLTATVKGAGKQVVPLPSEALVYMGNLMPQFSESMLKAADFKRKESQTIRAFIVDGGSLIPAKVTPVGEKISGAGKVRLFSVSFGIATASYAMAEDGRIVGFDVPGQYIRFVADGWSALYEDPFAKYPELSAATHEVRKLPPQHMRTRDGVDLVQDVILPAGEGKYPVIFARTPYGRENESATAEFYVKRGYAFVAQDCRGRFDSSGEWDPFVHEMDDGADAVNWIAQQPWCDGNVGMIGASYGGFVQWAAAAEVPPALKCIVPQVSPPMDAMHNLPYDFGVFFLYGDLWWSKIVSGKGIDMGSVLSSLPHPEGLKKLPLTKVAEATLGKDVPLFDRWLDRTGSESWKGWNFYDRMSGVTIPALHISGWFDGDEIGTNLNWAKMRELGRTNQWLIYGPWTHFFNSTSSIGDTDFGPKSMIDLETLYIRWFDTWLKHKDVGMDKIPHVQAFVTGLNKWLSFKDWPSPYASVRRLYLAGAPDSAHTSGSLLSSPRGKDSPTQYTFDPAKVEVPADIIKVDPNTASTDVTSRMAGTGAPVYRSAPLVRPMAISGPYEVELYFTSSARDTDFFVSLLDIDEKDHMRVFGSSGKIRCSYLQGLDRPRPLAPGKTYVAKVIPWDNAHELKAGHRLALVVVSDGFPLFARNMGTGEPIKNATRMVKQRNRILHDTIHPSSIRFHVLWD